MDNIDAITSIYSSKRKCYKWWKAVFFYLLDISIYNSSVIYYEYGNDKQAFSKMFNFRTKLYENHFQKYLLPKEPKPHYKIHLEKEKECDNCQKKRKEMKRVTRTSFVCSCGMILCKNCYLEHL